MKMKVSQLVYICACSRFDFFSSTNRANLAVVKELGDRAAQGRTYGNLGNTYYLLGDFETAVAAHEKVGSKQILCPKTFPAVRYNFLLAYIFVILAS